MKKFFTKETTVDVTDHWGNKTGATKIVTELRMGRVIACALLALLLMVTFFSSWRIIPTGYTGVRVTLGQVDEKPVEAGFSWKIPYAQKIKKINNKQQDIEFDGQIWSETSERTAICYDKITVTYTISSEKSAWIYANVNDYKNTLINSNIVSSALKTASKQLNSTDATNRGKIEPLAQEMLQAAVDSKYGEGVLYINKVIIESAEFEETYNQAIANKQNAQLEYEKQQIANKQAIEKAEADAEVKKKAAQGEADALKIKAEAEAEANKKIADSLTDEVLANKYYDTWDGKLPNMVGGNASYILPSDAVK